MDIIEIEERFAAGDSLSGQIDTLFSAMQAFGFDTLIYDYTPVRYDLDAGMMMPTCWSCAISTRPCATTGSGRGYFRQRSGAAMWRLGTTAPFFWNYDPKAETRIRAFMNEETACVADFLAERGLTPASPCRSICPAATMPR